eukprot:jgi/Ulvmu1/8092/UM004_0331.1
MQLKLYRHDVKTSAWILSIIAGHFFPVEQAAASTVLRTKEALLSFQSQFPNWDISEAAVPADQAPGWHRDSDPCLDAWHGVACACGVAVAGGCQIYEVIGLNLSAASLGWQLEGPVPDIFDQLPWLQHIDLANHRLQGKLPSTILQHAALQTVNLRNNFFTGPLHGPLSAKSKLSFLDVRFNMLSGEISSAFCNVTNLLVSGNSLICGSLPRCLRYMNLSTVAGTGLTGPGGLPRPCSMPVSSCTAPPTVEASNSAAVVSAFGATLCKAMVAEAVIGRTPLNIAFSIINNVDVLMLEVTDSGLHHFRAWFWAQDYMLRDLLGSQVQSVVGSKLNVPHTITRPGSQRSRATPPNAVTLNIADLPGNLLEASQLAVTVTAFHVLANRTEASTPIGRYETSMLQLRTPNIPVHHTPPEFVYVSVDDSFARKHEVRVAWQVRDSYSATNVKLLLLYDDEIGWNSVVTSVAMGSTRHVLATSPLLNDSTSTYTFRWIALLEASRMSEQDTDVMDSSGGYSTSQATFSARSADQDTWWQVEGAWPTGDGGSLVSPSMLLGHGLDDTFPTGIYMISIHAVDEHGMPGSSVVGPLIIEDDEESHSMVLMAAFVFASGIVMSACLYWCIQRCLYRYAREILRDDPVRLSLREVEDYFGELMQSMKPESVDCVDLCKDSEMCLVVSDMENSTLLSVQNPEAFAASQDIHDAIMVELIQHFCGVELLREGDSFRVAFKRPDEAIAFCLKVQFRLLETAWSTSVLSMKDCNEIYDEDDRLLFAGVRVRLGIYWAAHGSVVALLNKGTSTFNLRGPGMDAAVAISDSAHGGQTVLTAEVVDRVSNQLPLAGFPNIEHIGKYSYPDDRYSGDLFQLCGQAYKPLPRSFPPLRGIKVQNGPCRHTCSLFPSAIKSSLAPDSMKGQEPSVTTTPTLVCCSVTPLKPKNGSDSNAEQQHALAQLRQRLDKRIIDYATQWGGTMVDTTETSSDASPAAIWVWVLSFERVSNALRYVFSMQYGMLSESWKPSSAYWFPLPQKGINGQVVFQGPRITMVVHSLNVPRGDSVYSVAKTGQVSSDAPPSACAHERLGLGNQSSGNCTNKTNLDFQGDNAHTDAQLVGREAVSDSDSLPCPQKFSGSLVNTSLHGARDAVRSTCAQKNDEIKPSTKPCFLSKPHPTGAYQGSTGVSFSEHVQVYVDRPEWPTDVPTNEQPVQKEESALQDDALSEQDFFTDPPFPVESDPVQDHIKYHQADVQSPDLRQKHDGMWTDDLHCGHHSPSLAVPAQVLGGDKQLLIPKTPQTKTSSSEEFLFDSHAGDGGASALNKEIDFLVTLTACGLLHPGQIILTDCAFMSYQEVQVSVSEVYDHGVFKFDSFDRQTSLKELLPARLLGREFMRLCNDVAGAKKVRKGYHDAPSIEEPMCIGFCKLNMPQAVRNAEHTLMKLWSGQEQSEAHNPWLQQHIQMRSDDTSAGRSAVDMNCDLGTSLPQPPSQPTETNLPPPGSGESTGDQLSLPSVALPWARSQSTTSSALKLADHSIVQDGLQLLSRHINTGTDFEGIAKKKGTTSKKVGEDCTTDHLASLERPDTRAHSDHDPALPLMCTSAHRTQGEHSWSQHGWLDNLRLAGLIPCPKSAWNKVLLGNGASRLRDHEQQMVGQMRQLQRIKGKLRNAGGMPGQQSQKGQASQVHFSKLQNVLVDEAIADHFGIQPSVEATRRRARAYTYATEDKSPVQSSGHIEALGPAVWPVNDRARWRLDSERVHLNDLNRLGTDVTRDVAAIDGDVDAVPCGRMANASDLKGAIRSRDASSMDPVPQQSKNLKAEPPPQSANDGLIRLWRTGLKTGRHSCLDLDTVQGVTDPNACLHSRVDEHATESATPGGMRRAPDHTTHIATAGGWDPDENLGYAAGEPPFGPVAQEDRDSDHVPSRPRSLAEGRQTSRRLSSSMNTLGSYMHALVLKPSMGSDSGRALSTRHQDCADSEATEKDTCKTSLRCNGNQTSTGRERVIGSTSASVEMTETGKQDRSTSLSAQTGSGDSAQDLYTLISAFCLVASWSVTVTTYSRVLLELLEKHEGYLCKETDPGKFTVAFRSWKNGLLWAAHMKQVLALQQYPEDIMELPELAAKYDSDGRMVSRGAQPQIGCCFGKLQRKRPTAMGTADYYGVTANTAARIMAKASPGQVLIDGHLPFASRSREAHGEVHAMGVELRTASCTQKAGALVLYPLGRHLLKGIQNPVPIFEARATWFPDYVAGSNISNTYSAADDYLQESACLSSYGDTEYGRRHDGSALSGSSHAKPCATPPSTEASEKYRFTLS